MLFVHFLSDMTQQQVMLAKLPHVIVATPGRIVDHLEATKGFSLRKLQYLVFDEADRLLSLNFKEAIDKLLQIIPRERRTFLFSATMTSEVAKLQRASLKDPVKVEVSKVCLSFRSFCFLSFCSCFRPISCDTYALLHTRSTQLLRRF